MTSVDENKETESNVQRPELHSVRGLLLSTWFKKELVEEIFDYVPQDGDVIIATYPKTGTTWMQYIVHQILTKAESFPTFNDMLNKVVPFLEMSGVSAVEDLTTKPRVYKHHFPYNKMQKNNKAKIIYVYRKPEDTFVSYYHFMRNLELSTTFDQYFEDFLSGNISYGRYFEHVLSYIEREIDGNILMVSYEKLQKQRKEEILRVAKFLGDEYYEILVEDESILNKIIEQTSFDYMKENLHLSMPEDKKKAFEKDKLPEKEPQKKVHFFRKGIVGDGKNSLTYDQMSRLQTVMRETMKGTDILMEWLQD